MDISLLLNYMNLIIVGICLCVGYIIKNAVTNNKINRFIPLIMGCLGVILTIWAVGGFNAEILLTGLVSGLASTGFYETFKNLIKGGSKNDI